MEVSLRKLLYLIAARDQEEVSPFLNMLKKASLSKKRIIHDFEKGYSRKHGILIVDHYLPNPFLKLGKDLKFIFQ